MSDREEMMPNVPEGDDVLAVVWTADGHLDEGTIHTWLDGAFDDVQASVVDQHADSCATCREAIAEARGLIAGASRAVRALDAVPSNVVPRDDVARTASRIVAQAVRAGAVEATPVIVPKATRTRPWWNQSNLTRIAATLVLVVGGTLVFQRMGRDIGSPVAGVQDSTATSAASPVPVAAAPADEMARDASSLAAGAAAESSVDAAASRTLASTKAAGAAAESSPRSSDVAQARAKRTEPRAEQRVEPRADKLAESSIAAERMAREMDDRVASAARRAPAPALAVADSSAVGRIMATRAAPPLAPPMASSVSAAAAAASPPPSATFAPSTRVVVGSVRDEQKRPLAGAIVSGNNRTLASSDSTGRFAAQVSDDTATIAIRRIGFEPVRITLADRGSDTVRADVILRVAQTSLNAVTTASALTSRELAPDIACWALSVEGQSNMVPPNFIAIPRASTPTKETQWFGWPRSGESVSVLMTSVGNVVLRGTSTAGDVTLSLELTAVRTGWEGRAVQQRNGAQSTARVTLTSAAPAMCKY